MKNDKKSSVIKEALIEFNEIQEVAVANAKKNLAETYPKKFNDLLKEELNKNKTAKESYKKIDENKESKKDDVESNKKSVMKKEIKKTKKIVKEGDKNQPFDKKAPENGPDIVKEERDKDFMGNVEKDTPNMNTPHPEDGDTFTEKITTKQDTLANKTTVKEEFDITELDASSVGTALENAEDNDEVITMDEIEGEISAMNELETINTNPKSGSDNGIAYDKLVSMKNQIDEMIQGIGEQKNNGGKGANKVNDGGPTTAMIDEEEVTEQKNNGGKGANKVNDGGPTTAMIDEEDEISDADVEAVLGTPADVNEQDVEENLQHTQTHSNARQVGAQNNTNYGKEGRLRDAMKNESKTKISSLISENKGLTKKLNETKKYKQSVTTLVEQYKSALEKYRNQLKEMATFNTNLAHVNNLLVNESLALTQEDKIKIINEFKKVDTIAESQKKYKAFLTEMKETKPTLTESVDKVSASIAPSSKQSLDKAKEVTAYTDNAHINKIKRLIEYAENRGSKKII